MTVAEAYEIVLELAEQNVVDERDYPEDANEQRNAIFTVRLHAQASTGIKRRGTRARRQTGK